MKTTVESIARKAGVSAATVSRVMNGMSGVSDDKREKVLNALSGMEMIRKRKVHAPLSAIGIMLMDGAELDLRVVVKKITSISSRLSGKLALRVLPSDILPMELGSMFLHGEIKGLVLAGHECPDERMNEMLERIPHVWLNSHKNKQKGSVVLLGNEYAGKLAANYLTEHGCRNPAYIDINSTNPGFSARIEGFQMICLMKEKKFLQIKLELPENTLLENASCDVIEESIEKVLSKLNKKDFPDGIFSPEEYLTPLLYRWFLKNRIKKYPYVISCNYTKEYLAGLYPRPASIDLGAEMLARLAVDELLLRIEKKEARSDNVAVLVTPELIPGDEL